jgi:hypothetical protein
MDSQSSEMRPNIVVYKWGWSVYFESNPKYPARAFNQPRGIGVDPYSNTRLVYETDPRNTRIQVFKLEK